MRAWAQTVALGFLLTPYIAFAQLPEKLVPCNGVDCTVCHLAELAQNALNAGIYIAIFLSAILFAWAGWRYVTASGNPQQASDARKVFTNVVIGLVIIIAGWLVVDTLMKTLVKQNGEFGPWNQICS